MTQRGGEWAFLWLVVVLCGTLLAGAILDPPDFVVAAGIVVSVLGSPLAGLFEKSVARRQQRRAEAIRAIAREEIELERRRKKRRR